ncbi:MAG: outer membrane lipoprotein carrier protein LolA [Azoarcus sp.]|nr:outer membrane lipoprotein carrier protein LolA [Azoarcus sp.]
MAIFFCLAGPLHAADVLEAVRARLVLAPVTQGEFQQTRKLAQIKKPLVSNGRFLVVKELGVIWETLAPIPQVMRLTKNEILQTDGRVTIMRLSADKEPVVGIVNNILFGVLSGDLETLAQRFSYDGKLEGDQTWRLDFTPKDASLARLIRTLSLVGGRDIEQVEIVSAADDVTLIAFRAQTHGSQITDELRKRFESSQ